MCIPIIFGCPDKIKVEKDDPARVCRNCNNAAVHAATSTTCFELFWVPLIPVMKKNIWLCEVCNYSSPRAAGQPEPPLPSAGFQPPQGQQPYQPMYMNAPPSGHPQPSK